MIILISLNVYSCGSFNVYNVDVKLYFSIWLCFIDLEFLTHLGVKYPIDVEMLTLLFSKIFRCGYSFWGTIGRSGSVLESKRNIIMVVFHLYYLLVCNNSSYMNFCNFYYMLLVCKTFFVNIWVIILGGKMIGEFIILVNRW